MVDSIGAPAFTVKPRGCQCQRETRWRPPVPRSMMPGGFPAGALPLRIFRLRTLLLRTRPLQALHWMIFVTSALLLFAAPALASGRIACDPVSLEWDVRFLASDKLEGRGLGSEGLVMR